MANILPTTIPSLNILVIYIYLIAIQCVFLANFTPALNSLLKYGKTLSSSPSADSKANPSLLHRFESIYVSKSSFTHFYILSLVCSTFNILILANILPSLQNKVAIVLPYLISPDSTPITYTQFKIVCILNLVQAIRRSYECCFVSRFSKTSRIHISHYLVGVYFYSTINLQPLLYYLPKLLETTSRKHSLEHIPLLYWFAILLFILATVDQSVNHRHLAKLIKYNKPSKGLFKYVCCAHYFDELIIYLSHLMIMGNAYSIVEFIWVLANLSISSNESYKFYLKVSKDNLTPIDTAHYWRIIPFVY